MAQEKFSLSNGMVPTYVSIGKVKKKKKRKHSFDPFGIQNEK